MNLEGSVKLGFRKELEAIADPTQRKAKFDEMVATAYERGTALSAATLFEIDDVIDPARDTPENCKRIAIPSGNQTASGKKKNVCGYLVN